MNDEPEVELEIPRHTRQAELIPQEEVARTTALIVGCGAIGSWFARKLAHLGVPRMFLVDPDVVGPENVVLQGFLERQVGMPKVEAIAETVREVLPDCEVTAIRAAFPCPQANRMAKLAPGGRLVVAACLDDMTPRRLVYRSWRRANLPESLFLDGRMAGLACRVVAVDDPRDDHYESESWHPQSEAEPLRCTAKGTVGSASQPADFLLQFVQRWLRGIPVVRGPFPSEILYDTLTMSFRVLRPAPESDVAPGDEDALMGASPHTEVAAV